MKLSMYGAIISGLSLCCVPSHHYTGATGCNEQQGRWVVMFVACLHVKSHVRFGWCTQSPHTQLKQLVSVVGYARERKVPADGA
jgi:hypothetical protein